MTTTVIETKVSRKITVNRFGYGVDLDVRDTAHNDRVFSVLSTPETEKLVAALLPKNATLITDLPEAELKHSWVQAGDIDRSIHSDPAEVLDHAKKLLAIHAFIVKRNAEQEAAKVAEAEAVKAKEAAHEARRDELAKQFGNYYVQYVECSVPTQKAIDHIIELEEAAK